MLRKPCPACHLAPGRWPTIFAKALGHIGIALPCLYSSTTASKYRNVMEKLRHSLPCHMSHCLMSASYFCGSVMLHKWPRRATQVFLCNKRTCQTFYSTWQSLEIFPDDSGVDGWRIFVIFGELLWLEWKGVLEKNYDEEESFLYKQFQIFLPISNSIEKSVSTLGGLSKRLRRLFPQVNDPILTFLNLYPLNKNLKLRNLRGLIPQLRIVNDPMLNTWSTVQLHNIKGLILIIDCFGWKQ